MRHRLPAFLVALLALLTAACGGSGTAGAPSPSPTSHLSGQVTVLAAASLNGAFTDIGRAFHQANQGVEVTFSFNGSSTLAAQVLQGAPADLFASADQPNMKKVVDAGYATGAPRTFATNRLQIVVQAGNPKHIGGLADLARPGLLVVLCNPDVPCGSYAQQALTRAGLRVTPASGETAVTGVVNKVALGEADAGIVYTTDVRAAGARVEGVDVPDRQNVLATYPMVPVKGSRHPDIDRAFVDFVEGTPGQRVLQRYGFGKP
jgi:molybdate transport system substrate-binding protein